MRPRSRRWPCAGSPCPRRSRRGVPGTPRRPRERPGSLGCRERAPRTSRRPGGAVGAAGGWRPRGGECGLQAVAGGAVEHGRKTWRRGGGGMVAGGWSPMPRGGSRSRCARYAAWTASGAWPGSLGCRERAPRTSRRPRRWNRKLSGGAVGAAGGWRPRGGECGLQAVAGGAVEHGRKTWRRGAGGKRGHGLMLPCFGHACASASWPSAWVPASPGPRFHGSRRAGGVR